MPADTVVFLSTQNAGNPKRPQRGDIIEVLDTTGTNPDGAVPPLFGVIEVTNMGKGQLEHLKGARGTIETDPSGETYFDMIEKRQFYVDIDDVAFPDLPGLEAGRIGMTKQAVAQFVIDKETGLPVVL